MGLLDDFKKQFGIKTFTVGELNSRATIKTPTAVKSVAASDPLAGITITEEYLKVKGILDTGCQVVLVNGKAGTGKSTLIHYLRHTYKNNIVVVAPTGVAALNVNGVTLNSFFQLPPRMMTNQSIKKVKDRKLYTKLDLIIVDEISMVRADVIDAMDMFLRLNSRAEDLPFGGNQLLLVGDLFQLPPVVSREEDPILRHRGYASPFFFSAKALKDCQMAAIELTEIFRQRDPEFAAMLNSIRVAENLHDVIPRINERSKPFEDECSAITLTSTNAIADQTNNAELLKLPEASKTYTGKITGKFVVEDARLPSPLNLELKVGAQVMFTKNDESKRWVNGSLGRVVEMLDNSIMVELLSGTTGNILEVQQATWESYRYEYDNDADKVTPVVTAKYVQFPLMLAWAVTIHKSQGKTLEKVRVDLGSGAFASGQVYVALSRCRSLADISLTRPIKTSEVKCDQTILRFNKMIAE